MRSSATKSSIVVAFKAHYIITATLHPVLLAHEKGAKSANLCAAETSSQPSAVEQIDRLSTDAYHRSALSATLNTGSLRNSKDVPIIETHNDYGI